MKTEIRLLRFSESLKIKVRHTRRNSIYQEMNKSKIKMTMKLMQLFQNKVSQWHKKKYKINTKRYLKKNKTIFQIMNFSQMIIWITNLYALPIKSFSSNRNSCICIKISLLPLCIFTQHFAHTCQLTMFQSSRPKICLVIIG